MKGAQKWSSALGRMPEGHPLVAKRAVGMGRGEETMASPGYCSKETFLRCLGLEVRILSRAAVAGLLRVLPAPTCSKGSSQAGCQQDGCFSKGCPGPSGTPLKTLPDKTIQHLLSMTLARQRPSKAGIF